MALYKKPDNTNVKSVSDLFTNVETSPQKRQNENVVKYLTEQPLSFAEQRVRSTDNILKEVPSVKDLAVADYLTKSEMSGAEKLVRQKDNQAPSQSNIISVAGQKVDINSPTPLDKILDSIGFSRESFGQGLMSGATLGISDKLSPATQPETNPISRTAGELTGSMLPWGLASKAIGGVKAVSKISNPILQTAVREGLAGGAIGATEGTIKGESLPDIAKTAGAYALGGAVIGGGVQALSGKLASLKRVTNPTEVAPRVETPTVTPRVETPVAGRIETPTTGPSNQSLLNDIPSINDIASGKYQNVKPTTLQGKFTPKAIEPAMKSTKEYVLPPLNDIPDAIFKPRVNKYLTMTTKDLPNDAAQLSKIQAEIQEAQRRGMLPIDLQLFSEVEKKLVTLKEVKLQGRRAELNNQYNQTPASELPSTINRVQSSYEKKPFSWSDAKDSIITNVFDSLHPIRKLSEKTGVVASNSIKSQGTVNHIFNDGLVNKEGSKIGEALKDIYSSIPKGRGLDPTGQEFTFERILNDYMLHRHNIDRMTRQVKAERNGYLVQKKGEQLYETLEKPVFGKEYTPELSEKYIKFYEDTYPELTNISQKLYNFDKTFKKAWSVDGNLITRELSDHLDDIYPNYVSTFRKFSDIEKVSQQGTGSGNRFVNQSAPIKKAKGSSRIIIDPLESRLMLIDKTVKAVKNNEVGLMLLKEIRENPAKFKDIAEIVPTSRTTESMIAEDGIEGFIENLGQQFDRSFSAVNKDKNIVKIMEKGEPVEIKIKDLNLLKSLRGLTESQSTKAIQFGKAISNPFKSVVTSNNPLFAVKNLARDIPTAYINSIRNDPAKYTKEVVQAAKEMAQNGKYWQEYKALGGQYANFFLGSEKGLTNKTNELIKGKSAVTKGIDALSSVNNAAESVNRFAEYVRTVTAGNNSYESKLQGIFNASEITTDFSRHGASELVKTVDAYVPYTNAALQGLSKLVRQVADKPIQTIVKGGLAVTLPTTLVYMMNATNPKYKELDNRTKDNNYLIPNGESFIKIPKSRETGALMGALFERIYRTVEGDKNSFQDFGTTLKTNISPTNPLENNIFSPIVTNLPSNKDFADRDIVPQYMVGDKRSPKYQYDEKTSEIGKKLGDVANLSPKQIDYLIRSYTGFIGQTLLPATTKGGNIGKTVGSGFNADPIYSNQSVTDFYNNLDKLTTKASDKNVVENIPSKVVTKEERMRSKFTKASSEMSKIRKDIQKINSSGIPEAQKEAKTRQLQEKIVELAKKTNAIWKE